MRKKRFVLLALFLTVFIDVLGFGLVIPVLTPLFLDPTRGIFDVQTSEYMRNVALGLLLASFPFAQFFGAPILGAYADYFGRKKLLVYSLVGTFFGYLLFTLGIHFEIVWLLYVGRLIAGFMGGNMAVSLSIISDITDSAAEKTRRFGFIGVAVALGVILGPVLGGLLSENEWVSWFSYETPFLLATILAGINFVVVSFVLPETHHTKKALKIDFLSGPKDVVKAFAHKQLQSLYLMTFFQTLGFNFFAQFFAAYLYEQFVGVTERQIGYLFAYTGLWVAFSQGIAVRYLASRVMPVTLLRLSLFCLSFVFLLLLLPERLTWFYYVLPLVALFQGVILPNTTTIISSSVNEDKQGEVQGVYQSVQALAQVFPPLIAGFIAALNPDLPIVSAGVATLVAWGIFQTYSQTHRAMK